MEEKYLCIDIGFVKPGFVLISKNKINNSINIEIYENIKFNTIKDSIFILDYFFSQKVNTVILEQQIINKNISLMQFIHGYSLGKGVDVVIKRPFSYLRNKVVDEIITRTIKKQYSVNFFNNILKRNNIEKEYKLKDSDICDAINIGLLYIYSLNKKNIDVVIIKINKIIHKKILLP